MTDNTNNTSDNIVINNMNQNQNIEDGSLLKTPNEVTLEK
jgi:hypothetical protein